MSTPNMSTSPYAKLWPIVSGAVEDAFKNHPDYLTVKGQRSARASIIKRVCGTVLSFAEQSAKGRLNQPAETAHGVATSHSQGEGGSAPSPTIFRVRIGRVTFKRKASSRFLREFNDTTARLANELRKGKGTK